MVTRRKAATDVPDIVTISRAIEGFKGETANAIRMAERLATLLYRFEIQELGRWLVPPEHRPTCPVSGKPCTSWTCLVDVCVDESQAAGRTT